MCGENKRAMKKKENKCNKAVYTDGWAGAEMRVFPLFNSSVTDQPTDRPTDRRTKPHIELRVSN